MLVRTRMPGVAPALGGAFWLAVATAWAQEPAPLPAPGAPAPRGDAAAAPEGTDAAAAVAPEGTDAAAATAPAPASSELAARFDAILGARGGLTSEQVAARAVSTSHVLRSRAKEQELAELEVDRATAAYLPDVTLTARYTRLSPVTSGSLGGGGGGQGGFLVGAADPGPYPADYAGFASVDASQLLGGYEFPSYLNQYWLQAGVSVPISEYVLRAGHGLRAAHHNKEVARLNRDAEALTTAANAKLTYYDWVRAELNLVVAEQARALAAEQVRVAEVTFAGGRLSRADVLRAESQLANAELLVSQVRHQAILAKDRVRTAAHDPAATDYTIGEDVMAMPPPARTLESVDALYAEALDKRLEVRALESSKRSLEEAAAARRADNYPTVSAFGNAYYVNPSQRVFPQENEFHAEWDVGVEMIWTPTRIATARAETRKLSVQAAQRDDDLRELHDALRLEVMQAHQAVDEAVLDVETAERGLASAEEGHRVRLKQFEHGRATSVEVSDAETQLLRARFAVVTARVNVFTAQVRLEHAVGRDVPGAARAER